ncbi:trypsin-like serine peptidase [Thioclava sp. FR2]|uniref:trypsin-like serine peptidase n=1 Tax=Thioclava sp. FR2 TaxID=3445780 RepID=UPI003EBFA08B
MSLLLGGAAQAQNSGLERLTRADQITSWKAVGRVDLGANGFCTGTLIAADLVLTAAHCLYDRAGQSVAPEKIIFRAGFADGISVAESPVQLVVAHADYSPSANGRSSMDQVMHDVALLQLLSPISTSLVPPFAVSSPGDGDEVSVVSYARGRSEALSWQRACSVLGRRSGLIAIDCDVTFGSSGAPVFDRSRGRAQIVSIISSGGTDGTKNVALGMELPSLILDLKAQLRAGRGVQGASGQPTASVRRITVGSGGGASGARFIKAPGS